MHQNTYSGRLKLTLIAFLVLFCTISSVPSLLRAESVPADWLSPGLVSLQKLNDLAPNNPPPLRDTDCTNYTYIPKPPNESAPRTLCTFESSLGSIGNGNELLTGPRSSLQVNGIEGISNTSFFLPPSPDGLQPIIVSGPTALGDYLGFYDALERSSLKLNGSAQSGFYTLSAKPDHWLKDSVGDTIQVNTAVLSYSASGEWLVVDTPTLGLVRVNLKTFVISPFAPSLEKSCSIAPSFAKLAISDDGRYVAVSPQSACQTPAEPSLEIYDTASCVNSSCPHKDIWTGRINSDQVDAGIRSDLPAAQRPANLSFITDQNLSFDVAYDYIADTNFRVGSFLATVSGGLPHRLGLLGIGDSFISGQGEFTYRNGTDTPNNSCHLSELSYPFLLNDRYSSFNSAACSGATTDDITRSDRQYQGQVNDDIQQQFRNSKDILSRFLPGYINQAKFVTQYQPESILLSIGGNDVGFAKIVARCAAPSRTEPVCFDSWEDRADLVNLINNRYSRLVNTLQTIRRAGPASRVYVVGYPQIAKPGGACGTNVLLTDKEVLFASDLVSYLDTVIKQAAAAAGVVYVDAEHAFDGQRLCEGHGAGIAVNGFTTGGDDGITLVGHKVKFIGTESYHPTVAGHHLLAQAISRATNNLTKSAPAPQTGLQPPDLSPTLALLQNVTKTGRPLKLITNSDRLLSRPASAGSSQSIKLDGTAAALQPGGQYSIGLRSITAPLAKVNADTSGNLTTMIQFPNNLESGYDVLHITGKNVSGDDIDIQQIIYVTAIVDTVSPDATCALVPDSVQDIDKDGIDDICDPIIDDSLPYSYPAVVKLLTNTVQIGAQ